MAGAWVSVCPSHSDGLPRARLLPRVGVGPVEKVKISTASQGGASGIKSKVQGGEGC